MKTKLFLFTLSLLIANLCFSNNCFGQGSLSINIPFTGNNHYYEICISNQNLISCQYNSASAPAAVQIFLPHGGCLLDSAGASALPYDSVKHFPNSLSDIYYLSSGLLDTIYFKTDLSAIDCGLFFGNNANIARIGVLANTDTSWQSVPLSRPFLIFTGASTTGNNYIRGQSYTRTYLLSATQDGNYNEFKVDADVEREIIVTDVKIRYDSAGTIVDSSSKHIQTIDCSIIPADSSNNEFPTINGYYHQNYPLLFSKSGSTNTDSVPVPLDFEQGWKVYVTETFVLIGPDSASATHVSRYEVNANLCNPVLNNHCNVIGSSCDALYSDTMNVIFAPIQQCIQYFSGNPSNFADHTLDLYSSSGDTLYFGMRSLNQSDSIQNRRGAVRIYGLKLTLDHKYFSISGPSDIIVKTRDNAGIIRTLNPQPLITSAPDRFFGVDTLRTYDICFKSIPLGTDPDGVGPLTNVFIDPADTSSSHQYKCDLPGGNEIIFQINNIQFRAVDSVLHTCTLNWLQLMPSFWTDMVNMRNVDLCLATSRQYHHLPTDTICNPSQFNYQANNAISGSDGIPTSSGGYPSIGFTTSTALNTDLAVSPASGTNQVNKTELTYTFNHLNTRTPWDLAGPVLSCNNSGITRYIDIAAPYGQAYYAHVSLPPGYKIVPNTGGHTYTAINLTYPDTLNYDTTLAYTPNSCNEYDLVLPNISSTISFYVQIDSCVFGSASGCLSTNNYQGTFGTSDFRMEFRAQLNDAAHSYDTLHIDTSLLYMTYGCESINLFIHGCGGCPGNNIWVGTSDFSFERNSFGWQSDTAFVNSAAPFDSSQSTVGKHRAYINDDILAIAKGNIIPPTNVCLNPHLNFAIAYVPPIDSNSIFSFDSCTIYFIQLSGQDSGRVDSFFMNNLNHSSVWDTITEIGDTLTFRVDIDLAQLTIGSETIKTLLVDSGIPFDLSLKGHYHVDCNQASKLSPGHYKIEQMRAQFKVHEGRGVNAPLCAFSCDTWGATMEVLIIRNNISLGRSYISACQTKWGLSFSSVGGFPSGADFPGEYRPFMVFPDNFSLHLSNNLFFSSASFFKYPKVSNPNDYTRYTIYDLDNNCSHVHCQDSSLMGSPANPGGTLNFQLDPIRHKFSMNGDTITASIVSTTKYRVQAKNEGSAFVFMNTRLCMNPGQTFIVDNFDFSPDVLNSYNSISYSHTEQGGYNPVSGTNCDNSITFRDTLERVNYSNEGDSTNIIQNLNIQLQNLPQNSIYTTNNDTLTFCARLLNSPPVGWSEPRVQNVWFYTPTEDVEILSIERVDNCNSVSATPLSVNNAHNLFAFECASTSTYLRIKVKFQCEPLLGLGYDTTRFTLRYGEICNRCLLSTLNPDSASDFSFLSTCGHVKSIDVIAKPNTTSLNLRAKVSQNQYDFCSPATFNISYKLSTGQLNAPKLKIFNSDFDSYSGEKYLLHHLNHTDVILGSFSGDTLIFPITANLNSPDSLVLLYFPGCDGFDNDLKNFSFSISGINGCEEYSSFQNSDTSYSNHPTDVRFNSQTDPFGSLSIAGDTSAGCGDTVRLTIHLTYNSWFSGKLILNSHPEVFYDSLISVPTHTDQSGNLTWTLQSNINGADSIKIKLPVTSNACSHYYHFPLSLTFMKNCYDTVYCQNGIVRNVLDSIRIYCDTFSVSISPLNPGVCYGDTVTLTSSNASSYLWSTGETTGSINVWSAGTYTIKAISNQGCQDSTQVTLTVNPNPVPVITGDSLACNGDLILLNAGSGYSAYSWLPYGETSQTINAPTSGTYSVNITDTNGCMGSASKIVTISSPIVLPPSNDTSVISYVTYSGGNDGAIHLTVLGGIQPYSFLWSNGETTQNLTNLPSDTFIVIVTDSIGCTATGIYFVPEPPSECDSGFATYTQGAYGNCTPATDSLNKYFNGAFPSGLTIGCSGASHNHLLFECKESITNFLPSGVHYPPFPAGPNPLYSTYNNPKRPKCNPNGNCPCILGSSVCVQSPPTYTNVLAGQVIALTLNLGLDNYFSGNSYPLSQLYYTGIGPFYGLTVGDILTEANALLGGCTTTVPFTYSYSDINETINLINYAWDNATCPSNSCGILSCTFARSIIPELKVACLPQNAYCINGNVSSIITSVHGGTPPYKYHWSNGDTLPNLSNIDPGLYSVIVVDSNLNTALRFSYVYQDSTDDVASYSYNVTGNIVTFSDLSSDPSSGVSITWVWNFDDPSSGSNNTSTSQNPTHEFSTHGVYHVCLTVTYTNGPSSCSSNYCEDICVPPQVTVYSGGSTTSASICNGNSITLSASSYPGFTYQWKKNGIVINGATATTLVVTQTGSYLVEVSQGSCTGISNAFNVTVNALPSVSISPVNSFICQGGSATLTASGASTYLWNTGQATQSISATGGSYWVRGQNANGCYNLAYANVIVTSLSLSASINPVSTPGASDGSIILYVSGGTSSFSYSWSNGSTTQNIFGLSEGTYTVTVTDANGCVSQLTCNVGVNSGCEVTAAFSFSTDGCQISFNDESTSGNTITSWHWNFGDGTYSTQQKPNHTYHTPGTYQVCLTITATNGTNECSSTYCEDISVDCGQEPCEVRATFELEIERCSVNFHDFSTSGPSTTIIGWLWDFGDNTSSTLQEPVHNYSIPGSHQVCLTVFGYNGEKYCSDILCHEINTEECDKECDLDVKAIYNASNCKVQFADHTIARNNTTVTGWFWDFGDGTSSTSQNPLHTYLQEGSYIVCLTVFANNSTQSCQKAFCFEVKTNSCENEGCDVFPVFNYSATNCIAHFIDFSTTGANTTITGWSWDFGDGTRSGQQDPVHIYTRNGYYTVCLTVYGANIDTECDNKFCLDIYVTDDCKPSDCEVTADFNFVVNDCVLYFIDNSGEGLATAIYDWVWDISGITTLNGDITNYTFESSGIYTVCLSAYGIDANGSNCESNICKEIIVEECASPRLANPSHSNSGSTLSYSIVPNPSNGDFELRINSPSTTELEADLRNLYDQVIERKTLSVSKGVSSFAFGLTGRAKGIYLLRVKNEGEYQLMKIVIQ